MQQDHVDPAQALADDAAAVAAALSGGHAQGPPWRVERAGIPLAAARAAHDLACTLGEASAVLDAERLLGPASALRGRGPDEPRDRRTDSVAAASSDTVRALALGALGRFDEALRLVEGSLARVRAAGATDWIVLTEGLLAGFYLQLGQPVHARRVLSPLPAGASAGQRARRLVVEDRLAGLSGAAGTARLLQAVDLLREGAPAHERLAAELALAARLEGDAGVEACRAVWREARDRDLQAVAMSATVREATALAAAGCPTAALALAHDAVAGRADCRPHDLSDAEFWWAVGGVFRSAGWHAEAARALQAGASWLGAVLRHVPEPFRHGFLELLPIHRALRSAAATARAPARDD